MLHTTLDSLPMLVRLCPCNTATLQHRNPARCGTRADITHPAVLILRRLRTEARAADVVLGGTLALLPCVWLLTTFNKAPC